MTDRYNRPTVLIVFMLMAFGSCVFVREAPVLLAVIGAVSGPVGAYIGIKGGSKETKE